jgi:hypothetical protein
MNALEMSNKGYLLLFHSGEWWKELGREQLEKYVAESNAWLEKVMATGKVKGGQALARGGTIISGKSGRAITDGPFAESKEVIGGYLLLDVASFEEAVAIAKTAPNLAFGSSVEVRSLTDVCPAQTRLEELTREDSLQRVAPLAAAV